jgi:hypothetical protein
MTRSDPASERNEMTSMAGKSLCPQPSSEHWKIKQRTERDGLKAAGRRKAGGMLSDEATPAESHRPATSAFKRVAKGRSECS